MVAFVHLLLNAQSQIKYSGKVETGYHLYLSTPIHYEIGPGWKGHHLSERPNGAEINVVNGISYNSVFRAGLGIGYVNYEGINGYSVFGDLEYATQGKVAPLFNFKVGKSHINNQYDDGHDDTLVEISLGAEWKMSKNTRLQLKGGFRYVHETFSLPIRIGVRF